MCFVTWRPSNFFYLVDDKSFWLDYYTEQFLFLQINGFTDKKTKNIFYFCVHDSFVTSKKKETKFSNHLIPVVQFRLVTRQRHVRSSILTRNVKISQYFVLFCFLFLYVVFNILIV